MNSLGSHEVQTANYLYDATTKRIEFQWAQGIERQALLAARFNGTVINGISESASCLRLVLMGVALVVDRLKSSVFLPGLRHRLVSSLPRPVPVCRGLVARSSKPPTKEKRTKAKPPGAPYPAD